MGSFFSSSLITPTQNTKNTTIYQSFFPGLFKVALWVCFLLISPLNNHSLVLAKPQTKVQQQWPEIRDLYTQQQWEPLVEKLATLLSEPVHQEDLKLIYFLLAKVHLDQQNLPRAKTFLNAGKQIDPSNADLWNLQLFHLHLQEADLKKAKSLMSQLLEHEHASFYQNAIQRLLTDYASDEQATKDVTLLLAEIPTNKLSPKQAYKTQHILLEGRRLLGNVPSSDTYIKLWTLAYDKKTAKTTEALLQQLRKSHKFVIHAEDYLKRFQSLAQSKEYSLLTQEIPKYIRSVIHYSVRRKIAKIYLNALFQTKNYHKIIQLYEAQTLKHIYRATESEQLFWTIRSHHRTRNIQMAKRLIRQLEKIGPGTRWLKQAYSKMGELYWILGQKEKAEYWWKRLIQAFPGSRRAVKSQWQLAWAKFQNKEFQAALDYLSALLQQTLYAEEEAKILYWKAQTHIQLKQPKLAHKTIIQLLNKWPNSFYGLYITHDDLELQKQVGALKITLPSWKEPQDTPPPALRSWMSRYQFLLGVYEEQQAVYELKKLLKKYRSKAFVYQTAQLLHQSSEYRALQKLVANHYLWAVRRYKVDTQELWKYSYPLAYWDIVEARSQEAQIEPYIALSVMREESHFDHQAESRTKARGLMQLMEATAKDVAAREKVSFDTPEELFSPSLNVHLGTSYLGRMLRTFKQKKIYAIGAYNAGPHNMKEWVKQRQHLSTPAFIESVPFQETKNYIKRVMRTYYMYHKIYGKLAKTPQNKPQIVEHQSP